MIHGYHVIIPAYGFWLPNDPRGSWSDMVRKWELLRFGSSTKSLERRTQNELTVEEQRQREQARRALVYPPVHFTDEQILNIAAGFAQRSQRSNYTIWACAVLAEHTHLVLARHVFEVEKMAIQLKGAATRELQRLGIHPQAKCKRQGNRLPHMWAENLWKVYLDSEQAIDNAVHYVRENPQREGALTQDWCWVTPFAGIEKHAWITYH